MTEDSVPPLRAMTACASKSESPAIIFTSSDVVATEVASATVVDVVGGAVVVVSTGTAVAGATVVVVSTGTVVVGGGTMMVVVVVVAVVVVVVSTGAAIGAAVVVVVSTGARAVVVGIESTGGVGSVAPAPRGPCSDINKPAATAATSLRTQSPPWATTSSWFERMTLPSAGPCPLPSVGFATHSS